VGDEVESACSQVVTTERLRHETLASVDRNILRLIQVGLKKEKKLPAHLRLPSCILIPSSVLFPQLLSQGSANASALQVEVTQAREVAATVEATHVTAVLAAETSAQESTAAWDSTALHVKDAEDQAALIQREARERVSRMEVENSTMLASAREDAEGLALKIALLEAEHAEEHRAWELAEEKSRGLFDMAADAERWWEVFERERWEQFEELTLLQTQGFKLCDAIIGPSRVRNHLSEGMRLSIPHHTDTVGELAMLQAAVSSTTESALGCSPNEIFCVEVVGELVVELSRLNERRSWLEQLATRIYDLLLGPPPGHVRLVDRLDEVAI
jgi:hypothetical protein